ncbi:MAG: hypothetical protein ABSG61_12775 [Gemmatimonadales bacterium]|jgi:hypothetical protein
MRLLRAALGLAAALSLGAVRPAAAQPAAPRRPPQMLHPAVGKQDCLSCHGRGATEHITSVPAGHSYGNGACGMCHKPIAATPKSVPHPLDDAHADCRKCHVQAAEGATPAPGAAPSPPLSHATFHVSTCRLCHEAAPAGPTGGADGDHAP